MAQNTSALVIEVLVVILLVGTVLVTQIGTYYDELSLLDDPTNESDPNDVTNVSSSTVVILGLVVLFGVLAVVLTMVKPALKGMSRTR